MKEKKEFEVVEYYPWPEEKVAKKRAEGQKKSVQIGSLHIYVINDELDIRGIPVYERAGTIMIFMPFGFGVDQETKKAIQFPILGYSNAEKNKRIKTFLEKEGREYIRAKIEETNRKASRIKSEDVMDTISLKARDKSRKVPKN